MPFDIAGDEGASGKRITRAPAAAASAIRSNRLVHAGGSVERHRACLHDGDLHGAFTGG